MPIHKEVLADHVIYGSWNDITDNQFLVHYHPNGIHCTVFLMSGYQGYGGGIEAFSEGLLASDVEDIIKANGDNEYEVKEAVRNFVHNTNTERKREVHTDPQR